MVRYRAVTYSDAANGDNSPFVDADSSPIDSTVEDFSTIDFSEALREEEECTGASESLTVSAKISIMNNESAPQITYNPIDGTVFLLWSGKRKVVDLTRTWSRTFDDALLVWNEWDDTETVYTTSEEDANQKIYLRRKLFNRVDDLPMGVVGSDAYYPATVVDIYKKRMLVAWESHDTDKNIVAQLVDLENGQPYGNMVEVSMEQYDQTAPRLSFDSVNQRYLVTWEDARNTETNMSNMDVFAQFIDPQGQLSGGNFPVTVNSSNQMSPAVVFGDNDSRNFLIVWKDGRNNSDADIYGQFWEYSVGPQLLITDDKDQPLYTQAIDFGGVRKGQASAEAFRIWNNGNAQLNIYSITNSPDVHQGTTPDPTKPFNVTTPQPTTINPGTYYEMSVQFSPPSTGSYNGSITIDSDGGLTNIYFSGSGVSPQMSLIYNASDLNSFSTIVGSSIEKQFTISNVGNADLNITSMTVSSPFSFTGVTLPLVLAPGTNQSVVVKFSPAETETFSDNITIISDDPDDAIQNISVAGEGAEKLDITTTSLSDAIADSAYSQTLSATGGTTPFTWTVASGSLPDGISLDASTGVISGTPTTTGSYSFTVQVSDSAGQSNTQALSITVGPAVLNITTTTSLSEWTVTISGYSVTLTASGGTDPHTWSLSAGLLPDGLSLDTSSTTNSTTISGTPTTPGSFTFTVQVDESGGTSATKEFTITVNPYPTIVTTALSSGVIGESYSETLTGSGGTSPVAWTVSSGSLPPGITINTSTGQLSGTPAASGTYTFSMTLSDSLGASVTKSFDIVVTDVLDITTTTLPDGSINTTYSYTLAASGGSVPYTWSITAGVLPTGLSLNANTGVISGTPTADGAYYFVAQVKDLNGKTVSRTLLITVSDLNITTSSLSDGSVNTSYSATLKATGGTAPYTWAVTSGSLPTGLSLDTSTGVISGTPTASGIYSFTVTVTDSDSNTASVTYSVTISDLSITTTALYNGAVNTSYSVTIQATGGTIPYTWAIIAGALPTGLSLDANTGKVTGTPTASGTYASVIQVTDLNGSTASRTFSVTISDVSITTSSLSDGTVDTSYSETLAVSGGTAPYTWSITSGALPAGLSLSSSTGKISGTPTTAGSYGFTVQVTDDNGETASVTFSLSILEAGTTTTEASSATGGGSCFIATAAYGSYLDPHVVVLREFRDRFLLTNLPGRALVKIYYSTSPPVADYIRRHESLRAVTRFALTPLVFVAEYPLPGIGLLLFIGVIFYGYSRREFKGPGGE